MLRKTPTIDLTGIYVLKTPWKLEAEVQYTCEAIRTYEAILNKGEDVVNKIYIANGLTKEDYERDLKLGACLITLMSPGKTTIYVPDTYIESFPDLSAVEYAHIVLSATLYAVPSTLDLENVKDKIASVLEGTLGITPEINFHKIPTKGAIPYTAHKALETARENKVTDPSTIAGMTHSLKQELDSQVKYSAELEKIVYDNIDKLDVL